jgi:hypothetical protein
VALVCLGPTKLDLIEVQTAHEPQAGLRHDDVDEVWGLNAGLNWLWGRVAWDTVFIMDHLGGEQAKHPDYGRRIHETSERTPVITSDNILGFPHVHEYPLAEVIEAVGAGNAYFHNSVPYILAYALLIGVKELHLWGADYSHERLKDRESDRANAEYWVGFCRARGMRIVIPQSTTLLNAGKHDWFYGYQHQPPMALRDG